MKRPISGKCVGSPSQGNQLQETGAMADGCSGVNECVFGVSLSHSQGYELLSFALPRG